MSQHNRDFVQKFFEENATRLSRVIRRYLIPNRYSVEDVKQYIAGKMLDILNKRANSDNPIENPDRYFRSCLNYYCVEYQREHGYIFGLPRRPRKNCEEDEEEARSKGFKYLDDMTIEEVNSLAVYEEPRQVQAETEVWTVLTGCLAPEEADVMECIFLKNMTWLETSLHLGVAQSTCWSWKNRGLKNLFKRFDYISGDIYANITHVLRGETETTDAFTGALI